MEVHTETYRGYTIRIETDDDAENPFEAYDHLGTMLYKGRITLGNVNVNEWEGDFYDAMGHEPQSWADWIPFLREHKGATTILPVFAYVHGMATVRAGEALDAGNPFHCPWDSGQCGFVFDTAEGREMCGTPADRIAEVLKGEVETFDQWLRGEVYGYIVEHPERPSFCGDSCWGFYGEVEEAVSHAKSVVDAEEDYLAQEDAKIARCCAL